MHPTLVIPQQTMRITTQFSPPSGAAYDPSGDASVVNWFKDGQAGSDGSRIEWAAATGPNATNATSGVRPVLRKAIKNGRDIMRFAAAEWLQTTTYGAALTQPCSIAIVFQYTGSSTSDRALVCDSSKRVDIRNRGSDQQFAFYAENGGVEPIIAASDGNWHRLLVEWNGASSKYTLDGNAEQTASGSPGSIGIVGLTIGRLEVSAQFWEGDIAEIIVRSGQFADKAGLMTYLQNGWGL